MSARALVVWVPDWPVIAAGRIDGVDVHAPVAVVHANRVVACSPAARADGVRRGLRQREAQGRCPHIRVVTHDPGRDARAFEPLVAAVEASAPGVEILRPGLCAVAARGPARYFGGEIVAAERIVEHLAVTCEVEAQIGIADGIFAARLAARTGQIVAPGATRDFLAGHDIAVLERPELADLLRRLGVRTLADFAALPIGDVLARFGFEAAHARRLAGGEDPRPVAARTPPADLVVSADHDPPLDRVDAAAFAARALAEALHQRLAGHCVAATGLVIEARTSAGEELRRVWRHDGLLTAAAIADRTRWQLDGWLAGSARTGEPTVRPSAGIDRLRLIPDGVVAHSGMQAGLWGELGEADDRAHRALVRVQGLLGGDAVGTVVLGGGRGYRDQARFVPWGDPRTPAKPVTPPWPGRLPGPAPATVAPPEPALVTTVDGSPVTVNARLVISGEPAFVTISGRKPLAVTGWAGPWPVEERWWAPAEAVRVARFQLRLADGSALLVGLRNGVWRLEATYD